MLVRRCLCLLVAALALPLCGGCGSSEEGDTGGGSTGSAAAARTSGKGLIDWKLFGRVPERTHYLPSKLDPPLKQVWSYNDQALIEFPPVIARGLLFVVNKYSNVRALDAGSGKVVWDLRRDTKYKGPPSDVTAPVFGRGQVFVAFEDGRVVAINARSAKIEWRRELHSRLESSPLVIGDTLYIGSDRGTLYALRTSNGRTRWAFEARHTIKASPSYTEGVIHTADYGGAMFALRASDGKKLWETNTEKLPPGGEGGFYSSPAVYRGRVIAGRTDGTVYALDAKTGKFAWSYPTKGPVYGSPATAAVPGTKPTVYIGSYDHHLYALDADSGKVRWRYDVGGQVPGTAVVIGHTVYTSSFQTGNSIGIDVRNHSKTFSFASPGYTPMVSDGKSLFLAGYYSVHRLQPR
jgi:outer membrane protein assembly factor BamB